ncbi:D-glycero-alpha-D-manno-heptose-1,7-bisphosphate 7-phosphatase [Dyadobacter sp. CECT 9275]|uniref:D,D-heptose 1,7-bisphosphate phosphatase n=1 Tax=Dyadobacter helix TaxID=2822344 RepID=A0A916NA49_9BACT|nr:HAD family hydrolase [Dyadobacter sp. CECT 9275]CAG4988236.1 D-glycero-alpha-D-manno-heptose-1,7-bisphosphate 7-phosphatase [Dyadobacter sp. CECT 9275]
MQKNKCVFLDRDGVLNEDLGDYLYKLDQLVIPSGVPEALRMLKNEGFLLIVITNQAGIAKGLYGPAEVYAIHEYMQRVSGNALDDIYFSPHHPLFSGMSLSRKPDSLLIEKAIAKYNIDPAQSWMIGDRDRDMQAGKKMGLSTIHILSGAERLAGDYAAENLWSAVSIILRQKN